MPDQLPTTAEIVVRLNKTIDECIAQLMELKRITNDPTIAKNTLKYYEHVMNCEDILKLFKEMCE